MCEVIGHPFEPRGSPTLELGISGPRQRLFRLDLPRSVITHGHKIVFVRRGTLYCVGEDKEDSAGYVFHELLRGWGIFDWTM